MKDVLNNIYVTNAYENNLRNIDVVIPKNKLVVFTGVSGSGKSSLAFDVLYKEGQRKYLESLSSYARQFLGGNEIAKVNKIEGLVPVIAIDQKTTNNNPRSTVGTITEIYDYFRLLWAKIGVVICPHGHGILKSYTVKQIIQQIKSKSKDGDKIIILAPILCENKLDGQRIINELKLDGFLRVEIDGQMFSLDEEIDLKQSTKKINIVVDRIVYHLDEDTTERLHDGISLALKRSSQKCVDVLINKTRHNFSTSNVCPVCGFSTQEIEPKLFSFNSPIGSCPKCHGLGFTYEFDETKMIPNPKLSINQGGIHFFRNTLNTKNLDWQRFKALIDHYQIDCDLPLEKLSRKQIDILMNGSDEPIEFSLTSANGISMKKFDYIEGVLKLVARRHEETTSEMAREFYHYYLTEKTCNVCHGQRLNQGALAVRINDLNIADVCQLPIDQEITFFKELKLSDQQKEISQLLLKEIIDRLTFLDNVGLGYLSLNRYAATLSGGESQRIRLAAQIGSSLTGILYILDEPSIGLHQSDNDKLIRSMKSMRDLGNSLIVVEHDQDTIMAADYLVELGPKAGKNGGKIVACGSVRELMNCPESITGQYLSNKKKIELPTKYRSGNGQKIIIKGACANNIKDLDITFPLGKFIAITGVSGSGKSTLVHEILVKNIQKILFDPSVKPGKIRDIIGIKDIDKLIVIDQGPIGKTNRSNPATYVGVFDDIRQLFANTPHAIARGFTASHFSFNIPGGRCEKCQGAGYLTINMHFLPSVYIKCDECDGKRYNSEILKVLYKDKSIYDVLEMDIDQATQFFANIPQIKRKLEVLQDIGLGYLKLGEISSNLSGGESQRIKLAKFLQKSCSKNSLLVLDEPTTGLHIDDIKKLLKILNMIADAGTTVIVIEHNLDLIKCADHIIDLGPGGGQNGGTIVATGTPQQVANNKNSITGKYLKPYLK